LLISSAFNQRKDGFEPGEEQYNKRYTVRIPRKGSGGGDLFMKSRSYEPASQYVSYTILRGRRR
jgi:hypothetical protein